LSATILSAEVCLVTIGFPRVNASRDIIIASRSRGEVLSLTKGILEQLNNLGAFKMCEGGRMPRSVGVAEPEVRVELVTEVDIVGTLEALLIDDIRLNVKADGRPSNGRSG
jgi:hypothetical protein